MGTIDITLDAGRDLTIHRVEGQIMAEDVKCWIEEYYQGDAITMNTLWDFSRADVSRVQGDDIRDLARLVRQYAEVRRGGRTALVLAGDLEFGLGRMFSVFSAIEEVPLEFACFRDNDSAEDWLWLSGVDGPGPRAIPER